MQTRVVLGSALARCLPAAVRAGAGELAIAVEADALDEALDRVFAAHPTLRGYVLDEQGAVRRHVAIFLDGEAIPHRDSLHRPVPAGAEIYIMQALSGG